jgi:hypothetical protein
MLKFRLLTYPLDQERACQTRDGGTGYAPASVLEAAVLRLYQDSRTSPGWTHFVVFGGSCHASLDWADGRWRSNIKGSGLATAGPFLCLLVRAALFRAVPSLARLCLARCQIRADLD